MEQGRLGRERQAELTGGAASAREIRKQARRRCLRISSLGGFPARGVPRLLGGAVMRPGARGLAPRAASFRFHALA